MKIRGGNGCMERNSRQEPEFSGLSSLRDFTLDQDCEIPAGFRPTGNASICQGSCRVWTGMAAHHYSWCLCAQSCRALALLATRKWNHRGDKADFPLGPPLTQGMRKETLTHCACNKKREERKLLL